MAVILGKTPAEVGAMDLEDVGDVVAYRTKSSEPVPPPEGNKPSRAEIEGLVQMFGRG